MSVGALLSELIGAVGQDLAIWRQCRVEANDGPIEDAAPLTTNLVWKI